MSKKNAQNLRRGIGLISGALVEELNTLSPGLGNRLSQEINQRLILVNNHLDAQSGHRGTVTIAKQDTANAAGLQLQNDRVTGVAWATKGSDAVPLDQFRSFMTCDWFMQMAEDCLELPEAEVVVSSSIPDCWKV